MPHTAKPNLDIPQELIDQLNSGNCVLFVGDKITIQGVQNIQLTSALVDAANIHTACPVYECRTNGKCTQPRDCAVSMLSAAQLYEAQTSRHSLVDFVIHHLDDNVSPTPVHHALAVLPVRVIITTAYDNQLEFALRSANRPYRTVVNDADVPFDDLNNVQLIRLHGTISRPDSLVLTEDDTADLFARLPTVTKILQAHFASKTLLFIGYELSDPHFLMLYRQVTAPIARYQRLAYAIQWPPNSLATNRWRGKITLIDAEQLPFLEQISRSVHVWKVKFQKSDLPPEPYKFLDYYTQKDAAVFFGRDLEKDLLLSNILAHKLTVFYGRSGTGKTSLLLAKISPDLEEAGYSVAYVRMLGDPVNEAKSAVKGMPTYRLPLVDRQCSLYDVLLNTFSSKNRLVIILDQFEEFFLRQGEAVRKAFIRELADCLWPASDELKIDLRVVFSLRDDYLGALDEFSDMLPHDVFAHRYKLENLTRGEAIVAILKPAEVFGIPIEDTLQEQLIIDLEDQGLEPANLQIVMYRLYLDAVLQGLWSETSKKGIGLTLSRYESLGGTCEILSNYLDSVLSDLPEQEMQQGARAILKSMVTAQKTKAAVSGREIARGELVRKIDLAAARLDELLAYLREKRVVRKFGDEDRYELSHDVIVEKVWAWVSDEELRLLDVRDMLRREISNYQKFGHLLSDEKIVLINSCRHALSLDDLELDFIFRSALAREKEIDYWRNRAPAIVRVVEAELIDALGASEPEETRQITSRLASLASSSIIQKLKKIIQEDFTNDPVMWVNHMGEAQELYRTVLNLTTSRQRNALMALSKMDLPDATPILDQWTPPGMLLVPAGNFTMGSDENSDEIPVHEAWVDAFWIDRYPITYAQWSAFIGNKGYQQWELWTEEGWNEFGGTQLEPHDWDKRNQKWEHPVHGISWLEALAFARWSGKILLSEAEWEKAARSTDKRRFPWGNDFFSDRCNVKESNIGDTTPVGKYSPAGDSPYGVADMSGNVWEWCLDLQFPYPYNPNDGRQALEGTTISRVVRGGSLDFNKKHARTTHRYRGFLSKRYWDTGMRVGISPPFHSGLRKGVHQPPPTRSQNQDQGLTLPKLLELVQQAVTTSDIKLGEQLYTSMKKLVSDPTSPEELRSLGNVLMRILIGDKNPDLGKLPTSLVADIKELLKIIQSGKEKPK